MSESEIAERKTARIVLGYGIRALVIAMVVVGIWCQTNTQRDPGELLLVVVATVLGSIGLDYLVRVVTRDHDDE